MGLIMNEVVVQVQYEQTSRSPGDIIRIVLGSKTRTDPHKQNSFCFLRIDDAPYTLKQLQGLVKNWLIPNMNPEVDDEYTEKARSRFSLLLTDKTPDKIPGFKNNRTYSTSWAILRPFIMDKSTGLTATDDALGLFQWRC